MHMAIKVLQMKRRQWMMFFHSQSFSYSFFQHDRCANEHLVKTSRWVLSPPISYAVILFCTKEVGKCSEDTHLYSRLRADCIRNHYFRSACATGRQVHTYSEKKMNKILSLWLTLKRKKKMKLPDHKCSTACNLFDVDVSNTLISKKKRSLRVEPGPNYRSVREPYRLERAWGLS